jgi:hypothetical protein
LKTSFTLMTCIMAALSTPLAAQSANGTAQVPKLELVQARTLDDLLIQLQTAGFSIDDITRTFLGRIRVLASDATTTREIVMSRTTGEIFSDVVRSREPGPDQAVGGQPVPGNANSQGVGGGNASRSGETGSQASGGRSEGNSRSDNAGSRSNAAGGSRDNGGAGRSNRSD